MKYIIQKTLPVVVNTEKFEGILSEHPCLIEHPELFEIVEGEMPIKFHTLNYQSDITEQKEAVQEKTI
jgi:hypothetical protein